MQDGGGGQLRPRQKEVTAMSFGIKDIARLAGVSPATVSRILNDPGRRCASEEVRERVLKIAREKDYSPNGDARRLRQGSGFQPPQKKICCFFARTNAASGDQLFPAVARAVEQEAVTKGCALTLSYSVDQTEELLCQEDREGGKTGLIVLGRPEDPDIILRLQKRYPYTVFTGLQRFGGAVDQVIANGRDVARTALDYLYSLGHRKIGYIGEMVRELRYDGYLDFLRERRLDCGERFAVECAYYNYDKAYCAALTLMSRPEKPSAIFCANDLVAFGAIGGLRSLGYQIPKDVSIISVDNVDLAQLSVPMLTTIQIPHKEMAHFAVKLVTAKMDGLVTGGLTISLSCRLIVRDSAGTPSPALRA